MTSTASCIMHHLMCGYPGMTQLITKDQLLFVQPDLCVVCDKEKPDNKGCNGAPDLVIEILSPSTIKKDVQDKYFMYEKNGVGEYWMVHVDEKLVEIFIVMINSLG